MARKHPNLRRTSFCHVTARPACSVVGGGGMPGRPSYPGACSGAGRLRPCPRISSTTGSDGSSCTKTPSISPSECRELQGARPVAASSRSSMCSGARLRGRTRCCSRKRGRPPARSGQRGLVLLARRRGIGRSTATRRTGSTNAREEIQLSGWPETLPPTLGHLGGGRRPSTCRLGPAPPCHSLRLVPAHPVGSRPMALGRVSGVVHLPR
jgi:hypothetical protein